MDRTRKLPTYILIIMALGFSVYFFVSPFLNPLDQTLGPLPSFNQTSDSIPTLTSEVDTCVTNPTSDCDQEMLQIKKFCSENKDEHIPVCSDTRVRQYIDQRGLERPTINTGR